MSTVSMSLVSPGEAESLRLKLYMIVCIPGFRIFKRILHLQHLKINLTFI